MELGCVCVSHPIVSNDCCFGFYLTPQST